MLWLHIACHSAATTEIMPFSETLDHLVGSLLPGEAIWAGRAFWVKGWVVKMDGDGFGYEMVDLTFISRH